MANGSPATHQTLRQQGGTGEDSYIHLADWTFSVAAIEKKKKKKKINEFAIEIIQSGKHGITLSPELIRTLIPLFPDKVVLLS